MAEPPKNSSKVEQRNDYIYLQLFYNPNETIGGVSFTVLSQSLSTSLLSILEFVLDKYFQNNASKFDTFYSIYIEKPKVILSVPLMNAHLVYVDMSNEPSLRKK